MDIQYACGAALSRTAASRVPHAQTHRLRAMRPQLPAATTNRTLKRREGNTHALIKHPARGSIYLKCKQDEQSTCNKITNK